MVGTVLLTSIISIIAIFLGFLLIDPHIDIRIKVWHYATRPVIALCGAQRGATLRRSLADAITNRRNAPTSNEYLDIIDLTVPFYASGGQNVPVRVYIPKKTTTKTPLMLYIHGGGWTFGGVFSEYDVVCKKLVKDNNIAIVSVDYRLAPENKFPAAPLDVYSVFKYLDTLSRQNEALPKGFEFIKNIDTSKVIIGGDSAGGSLTAGITQVIRNGKLPIYEGDDSITPTRVETLDLKLKVAAQILVYPYLHEDLPSRNEFNYVLDTDIMSFFWESYTNRSWTDFEGQENLFFYPHKQELTNLPPAIFVIAQYDGLRDGSVLYAKKLKEAGNDVSTIVLQTSHTLWTSWYLKEYKEAMNFVHKELKKRDLVGN
jgi:acetyl esterase